MTFNSRSLYQVGTSLRSVLGAYAIATAPGVSLRSTPVAASRLRVVGARCRQLRFLAAPSHPRLGTGGGRRAMRVNRIV